MRSSAHAAPPILVVDDDDAIRDTLRDVLESEGYAVMTAADGAEAIKALRAAGRACVVLLDLMMPVMSGGEFLEALRRDEDLRTVPVLILSAWPEDARQLCALTQGFMKKPVTLDTILRWVAKFCGRAGAEGHP
jgi:CheY-like chemotaxis protein